MQQLLTQASLVNVLLGIDPAASVLGAVLLVIAGLGIITKGGDWFTDSAVDLGRITRIPPLIVGATIVSTATSFPEFVVALTGTLTGTSEFAVGNAIGSCLCNLGLIIGICAVTHSRIAKKTGVDPGITAGRDVLAGPGVFMLVFTLLVYLFALFDSGGAVLCEDKAAYGLSRWQAWFLFCGMFVFLGYSVRTARRSRRESAAESPAVPEESNSRTPSLTRTVLLFIGGCAMVILGSQLLVSNGRMLAITMGVPPLIVGLTLLAVGTSLPELIVSLIALLKGYDDLGLGNIVGSNVMNLCWVLASCSLASPIPIQRQTIVYDLPFALLLTVFCLAFPWKTERIGPRVGWLMLATYASYLSGLLWWGFGR
ncbi:MAG TPA: hypothetical protein DCG12_04880 [Planctomycetaceae bacterium]|nr:hypothetical protein [Planctomycetaceae bacterium]